MGVHVCACMHVCVCACVRVHASVDGCACACIRVSMYMCMTLTHTSRPEGSPKAGPAAYTHLLQTCLPHRSSARGQGGQRKGWTRGRCGQRGNIP